ncbi:AAA family ATPase [Neorhizobium sp. T786]|uniref:AAA family ATPase n=1 Tax=Pseudorhizobium xiangyangii TaxID=2883104 RepID=UPI001CFF77ED|nr:AAA family ATPase [Neorhizobium xiangyangii]MCB5204220.1 AAA family ATPase [Neorhizobium xiangyangii]
MKRPVSTSSTWDHPEPSAEFLAKHPEQDVMAWRSLVARVIQVATANGWRKADIARRTGMPEGSFSQWASGKYPGVLANLNSQVDNWLLALEESSSLAASVPVSPGFQPTLVGVEIMQTLAWAQVTSGFVAIKLDAGIGKTTACRHYCNTRPHAFMATVSPHTKTVHGMLVELAAELEVQENNPARLVRAIGRKLSRIGDGTLLIIDEAQNLTGDAINQLRHFVDIYKCGIALVGNEDTATDFLTDRSRSVSSKAQVMSRFDKLLRREPNRAEDAMRMIRAWNIEDENAIKFLLGIGMKPGALRQIDRTVKNALPAATGEGVELTLKHLQEAWKRRDLGDIV